MKTGRLEPMNEIDLQDVQASQTNTNPTFKYKINNAQHKHATNEVGGPYLKAATIHAYAPLRNSGSSSADGAPAISDVTASVNDAGVITTGDIGLSYKAEHFIIVDNKLHINPAIFGL